MQCSVGSEVICYALIDIELYSWDTTSFFGGEEISFVNHSNKSTLQVLLWQEEVIKIILFMIIIPHLSSRKQIQINKHSCCVYWQTLQTSFNTVWQMETSPQFWKEEFTVTAKSSTECLPLYANEEAFS